MGAFITLEKSEKVMPEARGLKSPGSPQSAFNRARVNIPGMSEVIWNPLYDYQTKTSAATSRQRFFQEPIGGSSGKTIVDTNMELNGQIPKGQAFVITGIQVELLPGIDVSGAALDNQFADDIYAFYQSGALKLTIGSKDWIVQGNLMKFPPTNRLAVQAATSITNAADTADNYVYSVAAGREFAVKDLLLESSQNFNVELIDTAALPSGVDARLGVTLNGWLYRNAQ